MASQKQKENTESIRTKQFSEIKKQCKGIPYWIPEPIQLKDFNPQRIVDLFKVKGKTLEETYKTIQYLKNEHYKQFESEYTEHKEIHESTLLANKKLYKNEKEMNDFIRPTCCYNHYFGLARKRDSTDYLPVFDYELYLVHNLDIRNFITFLASRGLGKTHTIIQRYSTWRVLRSNEWDHADVLVTTGLTQSNSTELLNKIESMFFEAFPNLELQFRGGTEMYIDKTRYIAFPAENLKKMRLYDKVAAVFVDEADFFSLNDQRRLQEVVLGYIVKTRPLLVFFSTPNHPNGFMLNARKQWKEKIEGKQEDEDTLKDFKPSVI